MKTILTLAYVATLFVLLMLYNGCLPKAEHQGLPDSDRFEYDPSPAALPFFRVRPSAS